MPFLWMRRADCSVFLFALMHPIAHKGLETGLSAVPFLIVCLNSRRRFDESRPYMETLQRIAAGMGPQRGFQSSLNSLLSLLTERHGFLRPHLVIFDPETRTLRLCVADGAPRSAQVVYEPGMGVTGQVFVTGKPVIVECLKGHPVFLSKFFMRTDEELSSLAFLSVPVLAPQMSWEPGREQARKVIGVLSVDTPRASREELERQRCFLEVVAGMIAAQATYLQDDMARQQRLAERRGDRPHVAGDLDGGILAVSESMCEALKQASYAGHGRGPVLLRGEPGTGKARVAAFIHTASVRNELPLVRFYASRLQSPGADRLTEEQAERELFGYRKGAFPGAVQTRKGLFELANCSTLFIEDIDKLSLSIQAQILHVLPGAVRGPHGGRAARRRGRAFHLFIVGGFGKTGRPRCLSRRFVQSYHRVSHCPASVARTS